MMVPLGCEMVQDGPVIILTPLAAQRAAQSGANLPTTRYERKFFLRPYREKMSNSASYAEFDR